MTASGSYGTKFQAGPAYPQVKIKFIDPILDTNNVETDALIDSGASGTFIPVSVINKLQIIPNNTAPVYDFRGQKTGDKGVYTVKIAIGNETLSIRAVETDGYAIIGRDILNKKTTTLKGIQQKWEMA